MDGNRLDGLAFHVNIPNLDCEVVTGENVSTIMGKADVGDGGDDFGKE